MDDEEFDTDLYNPSLFLKGLQKNRESMERANRAFLKGEPVSSQVQLIML